MHEIPRRRVVRQARRSRTLRRGSCDKRRHGPPPPVTCNLPRGRERTLDIGDSAPEPLALELEKAEVTEKVAASQSIASTTTRTCVNSRATRASAPGRNQS